MQKSWSVAPVVRAHACVQPNTEARPHTHLYRMLTRILGYMRTLRSAFCSFDCVLPCVLRSCCALSRSEYAAFSVCVLAF